MMSFNESECTIIDYSSYSDLFVKSDPQIFKLQRVNVS